MRAQGRLTATETDVAEMRCQSTNVVERVYRAMSARQRKTNTQIELRKLMEVSELHQLNSFVVVYPMYCKEPTTQCYGVEV